jgi:hypothetical protein
MTSSLYYSGDTGTNRGTSIRRPWDARRRAQIRSDVLHQAAEDLVNEQAQVKRYDLLYCNNQKNFSGLHIGNPLSYWKFLQPYMDRVGYKVPYKVNTIIPTHKWTFGSLYSIPGLSKEFPSPYNA